MLQAFFKSWLGWLQMGFRLLCALPTEGRVHIPKRLILFLIVWLLFGLLNGFHWIGFALDEIFFRGYRRVAVRRPVWIVGVPRSGTTFLQRALASEPRFTTLTLLECVLAPSVSERWFWFGLGRLLGRLVPRTLREGPGTRRPGWISRMDAIHRIGLKEPEEDFLLLLWVQACFLLVVLCPRDKHYWRLARFDQQMPDNARRVVFEFYRRCLQKHLYYHGKDQRLLSKNPSFTPMLGSLRRAFPDAMIVACVREPVKTVPSQLSSLVPAFELVGAGGLSEDFQERMIETLAAYYEDLDRFANEDALYVVEMFRLNDDLEQVVDEIFALAGHEPSAAFESKLAILGDGGRSYHSTHRYSLESFGLSEADIHRSFSRVWPLSLRVS